MDATEIKTEFIKVSLAGHFSLIQHYSNLLFKARVSTITLLILLWAIILGIGSKLELGGYAKAALPLIGSVLLLFLTMMELAYLTRYYLILQSAKQMEKEHAGTADVFFEKWRPIYKEFYGFYVLNYVVLVGLFAVKFFLISPSQSYGAISLGVCVAAILILTRMTRTSRKRIASIVDESNGSMGESGQPLLASRRNALARIFWFNKRA